MTKAILRKRFRHLVRANLNNIYFFFLTVKKIIDSIKFKWKELILHPSGKRILFLMTKWNYGYRCNVDVLYQVEKLTF
jgi:hypothetical protein